jgi:hypothetical protein
MAACGDMRFYNISWSFAVYKVLLLYITLKWKGHLLHPAQQPHPIGSKVSSEVLRPTVVWFDVCFSKPPERRGRGTEHDEPRAGGSMAGPLPRR